MFHRSLALPDPPTDSFFLWGPRQTGKTSLLRATYPHARTVNLLETEVEMRYRRAPHLLRQELMTESRPGFVVIDEVQRVPELLNEVHGLIERGWVFALCGSSARKVRRGHANLLGGRALRYQLFGLVSAECGRDFDLVRMINHGYLPRHYLAERPQARIRAYVQDYLKEEIAAEGVVRSLPTFADFLDAAALTDTELVNFAAIARECAVSLPTAKSYFQILEDTLLARFLPAYRKRPKRRVIQAPKFYFADVGVVNHLAKRGRLVPGSELFGKALENWVYHELSAHSEYSGLHYGIAYWRLASGFEVDFVLGEMEIAIEVKSTQRASSDHLKGLREIVKDHPRLRARYLVCLEHRARRTDDDILVLPATEFARRLWNGEIAPS